MTVNISTKLDMFDLQKIITKSALRMFESLNTPISLSCYILLKNKEYKQLVEKDISPLSYSTAWDFQKDNQSVSFLKKNSIFPTGVDLDDVAFVKFMEADESCRQTNMNLDKILRTEVYARHILHMAARKIDEYLTCVRISMDDLRFGPGASSSCSSDSISIPGKLLSTLDCSFSARWLIPKILSIPGFFKASRSKESDGISYSSLKPPQVQIVNSNRLIFVPKNSKTNRAICIEPHINIMGQLMVGAALRRALFLAGNDLSGKAEKINISLAQRGSIDGSYATIDLESASDTISYALVRKLLPEKWFELLATLRSEYTTLPDGTTHFNEKFSSMGNGFTFELESLIFYSIAQAVKDYEKCSGTISVFGDDIVCPTEIAGKIISVLTTFGFKINQKKTFISGPFRESCGSDFFNGVNVRAYHFKGEYPYVSDLFKVLNGIRHSASRFCLLNGPDGPFCHSILRPAWNVIFQSIPKDIRLFGPSSFGDQVIWSPRSYANTNVIYGIRKIRYIAVLPKKRSLQTFPIGIALVSLLMGSGSSISIRGPSTRKVRTAAISTWCWDEGDWLG